MNEKLFISCGVRCACGDWTILGVGPMVEIGPLGEFDNRAKCKKYCCEVIGRKWFKYGTQWAEECHPGKGPLDQVVATKSKIDSLTK